MDQLAVLQKVCVRAGAALVKVEEELEIEDDLVKLLSDHDWWDFEGAQNDVRDARVALGKLAKRIARRRLGKKKAK